MLGSTHHQGLAMNRCLMIAVINDTTYLRKKYNLDIAISAETRLTSIVQNIWLRSSNFLVNVLYLICAF